MSIAYCVRVRACVHAIALVNTLPFPFLCCSLGPYYRDASVITFENKTAGTLPGIAELLKTMPAGTHTLETLDVAPNGEAGLLVVVTGKITLEGERNPLPFVQVFELSADAAGPYIAQEIFR